MESGRAGAAGRVRVHSTESGAARRGRNRMQELYELLSQLDYSRENELVTVTGGSRAGQKALLTDAEPVWVSGPEADGCWLEVPESSLYREKLGHIQTLVVCGAGFVGTAVIRMAKLLGWRVLSAEDRREFADQAAQAGADRIICAPFREALAGISPDPDIFYVVVTREHSYDRECLDILLRRPFGYLGMMGSHKRTAHMRQELRDEGYDAELIARIHAPVGIEIGAQTLEEIAVSITAQMIAVKQGSDGRYHFPDDILTAILDPGRKKEGTRAALATVISSKGSTPRKAGARMLVCPDGTTVGTIGGGTMEAEVIRKTLEALRSPDSFRPYALKVDLSGRSGEYADMLCGGMTDIFLELV